MLELFAVLFRGVAGYLIERTLLTTGLTAAGCESLHSGCRIQTPKLAEIRYVSPVASLYMGAPTPLGNPMPLPPGPLAGVSGVIPALGKRLRIAVIGTSVPQITVLHLYLYHSHSPKCRDRYHLGLQQPRRPYHEQVPKR